MMYASFPQIVSFGDCDPAGIVHYPQMFSWMDRAFHRLLALHGGHAYLCEEFGAKGIGVVSAQAQFGRPLRDGDMLDIRIEAPRWSAKSMTLNYLGCAGQTIHFTGIEVRCMFVEHDDGLAAGVIAPLKERLG